MSLKQKKKVLNTPWYNEGITKKEYNRIIKQIEKEDKEEEAEDLRLAKEGLLEETKKKLIPLVDIRYVINKEKKCIKGFKKMKDKEALKSLVDLTLSPNNPFKFKNDNLEKMKEKIEEFNRFICIKNLNKLKRDDLKFIARKLKIDIGEKIRGKAPRKVLGNPLKPLFEKTGIKKFYTEKEQKIFQKEIKIDDDPFKITLRGKDNKMTDEPLELRPNQKKFIEKIVYSNNRGAIAFWGVGTGKTVLTVLSIKLYLMYVPNGTVIFIAPSALLSNLINSMYMFGLDIQDNRIEYFSFEKYSRSKRNCKNGFLIIDEAHNLRTEIKEAKKNQPKTGTRTKAIIEHCNVNKVLLLTATPFVNITYDIENLLAILDGRNPISRKNFQTVESNKDNSDDYFRNRISFYKRIFDDADFPEKRQKYLYTTMTEEEKKQTLTVLNSKDPSTKAYYSVARQLTNTMGNFKKLRLVVDTIKKSKNSQNIIYLAFVENGVNKLKDLMDKENMNYRVVSGEEGATEKQKSVNMYNNGEVNNMIITKAGAEGLDLKNTTNLFVMDMPWNEATREQVIGRGIRYKSHIALPIKKRFVNVYNVFLIFKSEVEYLDKLMNITDDKSFSLILQEYREKQVEKNKNKKGLPTKISFVSEKDKLEAEELGISNAELYKNTFNKYASKNVREQLQPPSTLTIDIFLFILSKSKQYVINQFEDYLKKLPTFEDGTSKAEKEIMNELEKRNERNQSMSEDVKYKIYYDVLKKYIQNGEKILTESNKLSTKNLKVLEQQNIDTVQKAEKLINAKSQEYFTQDKEIKRMYDLSGLAKDKRTNLMFLEPTAGIGNIVQYVKKRNLDMDFKLCEFEEDNRKELKKYIKSVGMTIEDTLYEENDFINLQTSDRFDYIFMNPPFNLDKGNKYTRNIVDLDFVRKAYLYLKEGGTLVALVYQPHINYLILDKDKRISKEPQENVLKKIRNEGVRNGCLFLNFLGNDADCEIHKFNGKFIEHRSKKLKNIPVALIKIKKSELSESYLFYDDELEILNKLVKFNEKDFPKFNKKMVEIVVDDKIDEEPKPSPIFPQNKDEKPKKRKKKELTDEDIDELIKNGKTHTMPNGDIHSGKKHTKSSKLLRVKKEKKIERTNPAFTKKSLDIGRRRQIQQILENSTEYVIENLEAINKIIKGIKTKKIKDETKEILLNWLDENGL